VLVKRHPAAQTARVRKPPFRTVRCIIRRGDRFLLVVHRGARKVGRRTWGLPGGRVERDEDFEETARREIREELRVTLGALREVGHYRYKGSFHKVLGTEYQDPIIAFDRAELLKSWMAHARGSRRAGCVRTAAFRIRSGRDSRLSLSSVSDTYGVTRAVGTV